MVFSAEVPLAAAVSTLAPGIVTAESRRRSRGLKQPSETTIEIAIARCVRSSARVVGIRGLVSEAASNLEGPVGNAKEGRKNTPGYWVSRCEFANRGNDM